MRPGLPENVLLMSFLTSSKLLVLDMAVPPGVRIFGTLAACRCDMFKRARSPT